MSERGNTPRPWWKRRVRRAKRRAVRAVAMFGRHRSEADLLAEGPRVGEWERRFEWPLTVLAGLFLTGYAIEVLDTRVHSQTYHAVQIANWVIYGLFGLDYVVRVALARRHLRYVWRHIFDLVILGLPFLRPLKVLRVVLLVRTLNRRAADSFGGSVIAYGGTIAVLICFCASLAVLDAERGSGGSITTFGTALWWSVVTISTVGYGDKFPVTTEGRFVAAALMITGVALFGAVTASFASWMVDQARSEEAADQQATQRDLETLRAQLDQIQAQIAAIAEATVGPAAGSTAGPSAGPSADADPGGEPRRPARNRPPGRNRPQQVTD